MTDVLLVRHAETTWNVEGRVQGWAPVPLSGRGRATAESLADHVATGFDVDAVVTSDLPRAEQTAEPLARAADVPLERDRRLRERDVGVYQGLGSADLFDRFPELDLLERGEAAAEYVPEGGESWTDVRSRVLAAWAELRDRPGTVVVVTHANPIRLVLAELKGIDVVRGLTDQPVDNCSITCVSDGELVRENETGFLE